MTLHEDQVHQVITEVIGRIQLVCDAAAQRIRSHAQAGPADKFAELVADEIGALHTTLTELVRCALRDAGIDDERAGEVAMVIAGEWVDRLAVNIMNAVARTLGTRTPAKPIARRDVPRNAPYDN